MTAYSNEVFLSEIDRGGRVFEGHHFVNCQFVECAFSLTRDVESQSVARDIVFDDCHVGGGAVGPGVLDNVTVNNLTTDRALILWCTFFRHVTFSGNIGRMIINRWAMATDRSAKVQQAFEKARDEFYGHTDWAIDISDARFDDLDIKGVPVALIRVDSNRQFVLTRERAMRSEWRNKVSSDSTYWMDIIDMFLQEGDAGTVLVVPEEADAEEHRTLEVGLKELRDVGVLV